MMVVTVVTLVTMLTVVTVVTVVTIVFKKRRKNSHKNFPIFFFSLNNTSLQQMIFSPENFLPKPFFNKTFLLPKAFFTKLLPKKNQQLKL